MNITDLPSLKRKLEPWIVEKIKEEAGGGRYLTRSEAKRLKPYTRDRAYGMYIQQLSKVKDRIELVKKLDRMVGDLQTDISNAQSRLDGLDKKISNANRRIDDFRSDLRKLGDRVGSLREDVSSAQSRIDDLTSDVSGLDDRISTAFDRLDNLDKWIDNLKGRVSDVEGTISNLRSRAKDLRADIKDAYKDIRKIDDKARKAIQDAERATPHKGEVHRQVEQEVCGHHQEAGRQLQKEDPGVQEALEEPEGRDQQGEGQNHGRVQADQQQEDPSPTKPPGKHTGSHRVGVRCGSPGLLNMQEPGEGQHGEGRGGGNVPGRCTALPLHNMPAWVHQVVQNRHQGHQGVLPSTKTRQDPEDGRQPSGHGHEHIREHEGDQEGLRQRAGSR